MTPAERIQLAFGKSLRTHREAAGISQEELAQRAGIHRTYVGDVERGVRNLGLVNMQRLAERLGMPLAQLWRREPNSKPRYFNLFQRPDRPLKAYTPSRVDALGAREDVRQIHFQVFARLCVDEHKPKLFPQALCNKHLGTR